MVKRVTFPTSTTNVSAGATPAPNLHPVGIRQRGLVDDWARVDVEDVLEMKSLMRLAFSDRSASR